MSYLKDTAKHCKNFLNILLKYNGSLTGLKLPTIIKILFKINTVLSEVNSIDFCNWLLDEYFIAFVPGEVFGKNGFLRCSYALSDDDLHEGLSRFSKAIKDLK